MAIRTCRTTAAGDAACRSGPVWSSPSNPGCWAARTRYIPMPMAGPCAAETAHAARIPNTPSPSPRTARWSSPPATNPATTNPLPIDDHLVPGPDLAEQPFNPVQVPNIDAAVRGTRIAPRGKVCRIVHRLAAAEEHRVRHGCVVDRRHVLPRLPADRERALPGRGLIRSEPHVHPQLRFPVHHPDQGVGPLADADRAAGHTPRVQTWGLGRFRRDIVHLVRGGCPAHRGEPIPGSLVDLTSHRDRPPALEPGHCCDRCPAVELGDLAGVRTDLAEPRLEIPDPFAGGSQLHDGRTGDQSIVQLI